MEKQAGTYYSYLSEINEIKSFIAFHHEYSQFYIRGFVKRYLTKALLIQQTFGYSDDVAQHHMEEIGVIICRLFKIEKESSEDGIGSDYSCTTCKVHQQSNNMQTINGSGGLNLTISMQSTNSGRLSIQLGPNISSSNNSVVINTNNNNEESHASNPSVFPNPVRDSPIINYIRNTFKRSSDEAENIENIPPKKQKMVPEKKLYVQESPEISNIIRKYQGRH